MGVKSSFLLSGLALTVLVFSCSALSFVLFACCCCYLRYAVVIYAFGNCPLWHSINLGTYTVFMCLCLPQHECWKSLRFQLLTVVLCLFLWMAPFMVAPQPFPTVYILAVTLVKGWPYLKCLHGKKLALLGGLPYQIDRANTIGKGYPSKRVPLLEGWPYLHVNRP